MAKYKLQSSNLKTKAKQAGIVALAALSGFGSQKAINNSLNKRDLDRLNKNKREYELKQFNEECLSSVSSKTSKIEYFEKDDIKSSNLRKIKFKQIIEFIPEKQRTAIENIINNKIIAVEKEMSKNPVLKKKILSKCGNYKEYLLSLGPEKLENIFSKKELIAIKTELNKIPTERLIKLRNELQNNFGYSLLGGLFTGLLLGGIGLESLPKKKKENNLDFHYKFK